MAERPSTSPKPTAATPIKGGTRLFMAVPIGVPATAAAGSLCAATYAASSLLEILCAGLFADSKGRVNKDNLAFSAFQFSLEKMAEVSMRGGKTVVSFNVDQIREGIAEMLGQEDFKKHSPMASQVKGNLEQLVQERRGSRLDKDDADEYDERRDRNEAWGLTAGGQEAGLGVC